MKDKPNKSQEEIRSECYQVGHEQGQWLTGLVMSGGRNEALNYVDGIIDQIADHAFDAGHIPSEPHRYQATFDAVMNILEDSGLLQAACVHLMEVLVGVEGPDKAREVLEAIIARPREAVAA